MNSGPILLVEDSSSDIELTRRAFEKAHISNELVAAEDGQEALDYLSGTGPYLGREIQEVPILILLDLKMPGMDGLEVLRRIRADQLTRRVPVVILTSSIEERDVRMGYDLGVNSYIRKPVDFTRFIETIQDLGLY